MSKLTDQVAYQDEPDDDDDGCLDYIEPDECVRLGQHCQSCDDDGFCNSCGHGHED